MSNECMIMPPVLEGWNGWIPTKDKNPCAGCVWKNRKRPQKCSCCRRNFHMKDCYERAGGSNE